MIIINSNLWVKETEKKVEHGVFPEGTFLKKGEEITKVLQEKSSSVEQAIKRLNYYINRGGKDVANKEQLDKAMTILHKKLETMKQKYANKR